MRDVIISHMRHGPWLNLVTRFHKTISVNKSLSKFPFATSQSACDIAKRSEKNHATSQQDIIRSKKRNLSFNDLTSNRQQNQMLPIDTPNETTSRLQAMKDDDDFFFEPLPLERQETIYEDTRVSKKSMNNAMAFFMDITQQWERRDSKHSSSDRFQVRKN